MSEPLLTWDTVELRGAITCEDLTPLRNVMVRGGNLTMPQAAGSRPYAGVLDELECTLRWHVTGVLDPSGAAHADRGEGLEENLDYYRDLFWDPLATYGLHPIELSWGGLTYMAEAQCWGWAAARTAPWTAEAITRLVVPAGQLGTGS